VLDAFNPTRLDIMCAKSLQAINDSWTTSGLTRGMRALIKLINEDFQQVILTGEDIRHLMEGVYNTFHERFKFLPMEFPPLDFENPRLKLQVMVHETEQFCKDPVNIYMTEKRYMVRRFWRQLIEQARTIFNEARMDTERWITAVPLPLETQIRDHKMQLESRLASLQKINERGGTINEEVNKLSAQRDEVRRQINMIADLIRKVRDVGPAPETRAVADAQPKIPTPQKEFLETVRVQKMSEEQLRAGRSGDAAAVNDQTVPMVTSAGFQQAAPPPPPPRVTPSPLPSATPIEESPFMKTVKLDLTKLP
jgi:hypothetical protein